MRRLSIVAVFVGGTALAAPEAMVIVKLGTPATTGAVDAKALVSVMTASKAELSACHRKAFAKLPARGGTVVTTFTIATDGKVSVVAATGLGDELGACLSATISKLAFGKPSDGKPITVTYPLTFTLGVGAGGNPGGGSSIVAARDGDGGLLGTEVGEMDGAAHLDRSPGSSAPGVSGGQLGLAARSGAEPTVTVGVPRVTGDLDKAIVRRYLKRNLSRLKYCYEKLLATKPTLGGTVTAEFTIGADGRVGASKASGLKEPDAETCMAAVIKAIEFPRPKSGEVTVRYPLTLRPAMPAAAKPAPAKPAPAKPAPAKPAPETPAPAPSK